ncbi:MAG TPA: AraC family transcriptional regulator [Thermomicrobiales bacterium]|nr:AraC family transcriptional regulator [Thermomicrobiales bacterium]
MGAARLLNRQGTGPPVYTYEAAPGVPPVTVLRLDRGSLARVEAGHAHAHDFLLLAYFERGGGAIRVGGREWRVEAGDVYLVAPGEVVGAGGATRGFAEAAAWGVYFPPDVLGHGAPGSFLAWRAHPLLFPFVRGAAGGAQRLRVPPADRPAWSARLAALDRELQERRDGYHEAALAHLTLLLVAVGRLATDVAGDLRLRDEPLLADVFGYIEGHYGERVSLRDVARAVSLTPGYLTTVVRRKTGRTVQDWLAERRLAEARRLLVETDLAVEEVGRRVGYGDPAYFARSFRRAHGTTPLGWRRAGRP